MKLDLENLKPWRGALIAVGVIVAVLFVTQVVAYILSPGEWHRYVRRVPEILGMVVFWGPIVALIAASLVWGTLRVLGFRSLEEIRIESVEQNNPAPAIVLVGTLIAAILFLMLIIRP